VRRAPKAVLSHEPCGFGGMYRLTAPDGWCFEKELHERVYHYEDIPGHRRERWLDAKREQRETTLIPCAVPNCEWCKDA
jgi:hypothetical protein